MNNYIHKIIDFFFHHEVSDEITERVYNRMVFPVEDKAREEAVSQIWDKLDDASCSDEKIEKAFYNLETSLGLKKEEQTVELVHREHIRNTKRINWGRVAAIWTIPFIMLCFSAYYYYSAKDYVKETLSEVTYMQRYFAFYRNPGADMMLSESQVEKEYLESAKAFHFGTLSMTHEEVRKATQKAITIAKEAGMLISFDPNLRPPLWSSMELAKEQIAYGLGQCDLLKISEEELEFMTGTKDIKEGAHKLLADYPNLKLMNVTMGKEGSIAFHEGKEVFHAPFLQENTIETTGAGDTFGACALNYVLENEITGLSEEQLYEMLEFANGASSLITTKKGALRVMPTKEDVETFISTK